MLRCGEWRRQWAKSKHGGRNLGESRPWLVVRLSLSPLEGFQESDKVILVLLGKMERETHVVEIDRVH
jgi:hypothetical protein